MPRYKVIIGRGGEVNPFTGERPRGYEEKTAELEAVNERAARMVAGTWISKGKKTLKGFEVVSVEPIDAPDDGEEKPNGTIEVIRTELEEWALNQCDHYREENRQCAECELAGTCQIKKQRDAVVAIVDNAVKGGG